MRVTTILTTIVCVALIAGCAGPARMDSKTIAAQGGILKDSKGKSIHPNSGFIRKGNASVVAAGDKLRQVTELDTQIDILESAEINVVSMLMKTEPKYGGKAKKIPRITIHTAFFQYVTQEEDEIAAMIAHHLAHIALGHVRPTTASEKAVTVTSHVSQRIVNSFIPFTGLLIGAVVNRAVDPVLVAQEEEADRLGFSYLVQAGYDGNAMLSMWTKLRKAEKDKGNLFKSLNKSLGFRDGHPTNENRLKYLGELASETNTDVQD